MYLAEVLAENFRIFGSEADGKELCVLFKPGLNALVGENDGGKSAIIDAIRYCLWTTSQDYHRFTTDDFHCGATERASTLRIRCKFEDLCVADQATFMEWLTSLPTGDSVLYMHLRATRLGNRNQGRISVETHSGKNGEGPAVEGMMRELLKTTYLRPLRDAETELSPGRNSRLSQILGNHPDISTQETDDFDPQVEGSGKTLVGIMKRAEHEIGRNAAILNANTSINDKYLGSFQIGTVPLLSEVGVAGNTTLGRILEKLELVIARQTACAERTRRGLGYNNALFMSAELLLLGSGEAYPTLLIEEPEAHLHPQMQANVIALLDKQNGNASRVTPENIEETTEPSVASVANQELSDTQVSDSPAVPRPVQVVMTTHSPNIACSIPLDRIIIVSAGSTYSLAPDITKLERSDYAFLERFLDVTKANLFFARGVAIVEGDAENLLLPVLAEKVGYSFRTNGVSVVNVGHIGLFRYSNIFRRQDGAALPIRVACLRDRDIVPDCAPDDLKKKLKKESDLDATGHTSRINTFKMMDGESVRTFVSDHWTFEYDLAAASWEMARVMHQAIQCAVKAEHHWLDNAEVVTVCATSDTTIRKWKTDGWSLIKAAVEIYTPLRKDQASKPIAAQFAAKFVAEASLVKTQLPAYLLKAFEYLTEGKIDEPAA